MKINQIIFDFDGVIINSHKVKSKAFYHVFKDYGKNKAQKAMKYHLKNTGVSRFIKFKYILKKIIKININKKILKDLDRRFNNFTEKKIKKLKPSKSLNDFLKTENKKINFYISSGTPQKQLPSLLKNIKLGKYFKKVYGSPDNKIQHIKKILKDLDRKFNNFTEKKIKKLKPSKSLNDFLKTENKRINFYISSGTPQKQLPSLLKNIKLTKYFEKVYGSPDNKVQHIKKILKKNSSTIFVGDSLEDFLSANKMNIKFFLKVNSENKFLQKKNIQKIYNFKNFKLKLSNL